MKKNIGYDIIQKHTCRTVNTYEEQQNTSVEP